MATPPAKMTLATPSARHWYYFLKNERGLFRPELHQWMENFYAEQDRQVALEKVASSQGAIDEKANADTDTQKSS
ncbi:MAG: hypothetical protein KUG71_05240 [Porticoccaceae bacterium]|nr:hypothetical protein [Porticoccaceae bacterium]